MYRIIIDSCGELTEEMKQDPHYCNVALTLQVDGEDIVDDESFDQLSFIKKVAASLKGPKSACPSPDAYLNEMKRGAKRVYVVTLSAKLSGSYNSAMVAKSMLEEEEEDLPEEQRTQVYVFNSKSASIGETLIGMKITEGEAAGMSFEEIIESVEEYIKSQHTFFVLETLETFRKSGRLSNVKAAIATALKIKPVMASTDEGDIEQVNQGHGMRKAMDKMIEHIVATATNAKDKVLAISHCNCAERAEQLKEKILQLGIFKNVVVVDMRGVSTMYANDGGIIMVV